MANRLSETTRKLRCAIYTRKSTEEGLEQHFNSLDAQREACAAYILSQRHEGWTRLPDIYDDGGVSGGTMDRPALRSLLAQVAAGKVDVIVVYKVDRLTRSLADFAKIVEILDKAEASFVSVTQAFNTTSSMGRLTLNVLLSFAQFEREVTAERIRDKIAASKAKGIWMGGTVPLGYDVVDRALVVNEPEAAQVRMMYERYLAVGSGRQLQVELERTGIRSKRRIGRDGCAAGGLPITRGPLYVILQNRLYLGEIVHKGQSYPGQHHPILDRDLFERVQQQISTQRTERRLQTNADAPSLLAGLLRDAHGRMLSPSHAVKGDRRYRYYVSQTDAKADRTTVPPWRIAAIELERIVRTRLIDELASAKRGAIEQAMLAGSDIQALDTQIAAATAKLEDSGTETRALMLGLVQRIDVDEDALVITADLAHLHPQLGSCVIETTLPPTLVRSAKPQRILIPAPTANAGTPDQNLLRLLARAFAARADLARHGSIAEAAKTAGYSRDYHAALVRLSWLAPDIVIAILEGRQPKALTSTVLARTPSLPIDWREQRTMFGFG